MRCKHCNADVLTSSDLAQGAPKSLTLTDITIHNNEVAQSVAQCARPVITDDMIDRAIEAHVEPFDSGDAVGAMRAALEAALTSTDLCPGDGK